ncbi:restriction endonuclease [Salinicola tamaricis]|uniref:restriction endonuclease n=1 Tax=Salinicola tamaricis TaxID=1771309 RepID=UPI000D09A20C|nr:restriction endonuclease [Salinicola tamaricis]
MNNIVNFKEIPPGNGKDDAQDEFELFVRDLLVALGYDIVKEPARGGDDGIDLVVREYSYGPMGKNSRLVGVSCKHNAHSNKAVGREDEKFNLSVADAFGFKVFYAFYSTIASESLGRTLANLGKKLDEVKVFDHSLISVLLRENDASLRVFRDYFPVSFGGYHLCNRGSGIYRSPPVMECDFCSNNVISRFEGWFVLFRSMLSKIMVVSIEIL